MTKEELKQHCEKQVECCETWARNNGGKPHGKIYEEHKLILDLIKALEQQPSEDCVSRQAVIAIASDSCLDLDNYEDTKEFCDEIKNLPPVTPTYGTCKDCSYRDPEDKKCDCGHDIQWQLPREDNWYCKDFEKAR